MIYSCFDPPSAEYLYFEDDKRHPLNGDLAVPQMPPETNGIGVPSQLAARPLPSGARYTGRGWNARGVIVRCPESNGVGAIPSFGDDTLAYVILAGVAGLALYVALGDF